jgi:type I restriction enzyme S subunit
MSSRRSAHHTFIERYGIPPGWAEFRLRDAADIVGGGTPDSSEPRFWNGEIPWLTPTEMTNLKRRVATTSERRITPLAIESSNCRLLEPGSLVISTRGTIGNVAIAGVPLTCNQSCEALVPKEGVNSDYLYYLLCYIRPILERFGAGTTFTSVTRRDIRDIRFALPKCPEQIAIAEILVATDQLIEGAEAKLTAARRLKAALMQQLFTRGIPGRHKRFKQTKIGEIPDEWDVCPIRSVLDGPPFNGVSPQSRPDPPGTPILNVQCIEDGMCTTVYATYVDVDEQTKEECRARRGDFYVVRGNGNRNYVATGGLLADEPAVHTIFSDKLIRLRFRPDKVVERFVPYLWQSRSFLYRLQSKAECGSGLWMMGKRDICRELFACPSRDEQREIVTLVDSAVSTIAAGEGELTALRRVKSSLLQNLLTGRVRVKVSQNVNGNHAISRTA